MKTVATLILVALSLALPSAAYAGPFTPDRFQFEVLSVAWRSTGTDTFCWQCEDADPNNDLMGSLPLVGTQFSGEFSPVERSLLRFTMDLTGTATEFDRSLVEIARIEVRLFLYDLLVPELFVMNPEYPLPSVSYGHWFGYVQGYGEQGFRAECCSGFVNQIALGYWLPRGVYQTLPIVVSQTMFADRFGASAYTPEITGMPEPTTLLLLGSGLIGAEWKRRRRHSAGSPAVQKPQAVLSKISVSTP